MNKNACIGPLTLVDFTVLMKYIVFLTKSTLSYYISILLVFKFQVVHDLIRGFMALKVTLSFHLHGLIKFHYHFATMVAKVIS